MSEKRMAQFEETVRFEPLESRMLLSGGHVGMGPPAPVFSPRGDMTATLANLLQPFSPVPEAEANGGPTNNDLATAQDLAFGYFVPGQPRVRPGPQRAVVIGQADGAGQAASFSDSQTIFGYIAAPNSYQMEFDGAIAPGGGGVLTITAKADLAGTSKYLSLQAEGMDLGTLFVDSGQTLVAVTAQVALTQQQLATLAADGVITFTITPSNSVARVGMGYVQMDLSYDGAGTGGTPDFYRFDLATGQLASMAVKGASGSQLDLQLSDSTGAVIATGTTDADGAMITDFVATRAGTYYVRVAGTGGYTLAVNRGAGMEDDGATAAQPLPSTTLDGARWLTGAIGAAGDSDRYAVTLDAGSLVKIKAFAFSQDSQPTGLQPMIRIYDAAGNLLAASLVGDTPGVAELNYRCHTGGTYYIELVGADDTTGEYALSVQQDTSSTPVQPQKHSGPKAAQALADPLSGGQGGDGPLGLRLGFFKAPKRA